MAGLDVSQLKLPDIDFLNPSKGIQCYTYNCVSGCSIELSVPGKPPLIKSGLKRFTIDHLELERKDTTPPYFNGIFRCRVLQHGREVFNKWVEINAITGTLGQGTMKTLVDQTSLISNDICVTHCFYDAPHKGNIAGLPYRDQFYVTVSPNNSAWLSTIAPLGSVAAAKPFRRLVLPAAHDVGMNSLHTSDILFQRVGGAFARVRQSSATSQSPVHFPRELLPQYSTRKHAANFTLQVVETIAPAGKDLQIADILKGPLIPNVIQSSSITQKDELQSMLAIGARYFEFRPAHLHQAFRGLPQLQDMKDKLFFMHGPIPGMGYDDFLDDCVAFLVRHPGEIVVVHLRWDGVPVECARPTPDDLDRHLSEALKAAQGGALQIGHLQEMTSQTIDELRRTQRRLLVIQNVDNYNIYSDQANATLDGDSIVAQFNNISTAQQDGKAFTNIQCQATATNLGLKIWFSAIAATASNSWLLATKAICDSKTMPWVKDKALEKLPRDQLLVLMDDFVDGGMCDVALDLSMQRLKKP
ncbi:PLC-like phosphodiesterase [Cladophialophora carrionii]|uniref:PLC-like phosphodiesterase n=1 Tax=Cladophialophora carrionii TaxID=86049 RepID=A0A1C1CFH6_9EURO|nr:PLC-like phosphodiesterase [Cladophialophora carrionii]